MASPVYRQAVAVTQSRLDELVAKAGIARTRGLFRDFEEDLERGIRRNVRIGSHFDAHVQRGILLQVRTSLARLAGPWAQLVRTGAAEAMTGSLRTLAQQVGSLERHFSGATLPLPLLEAARFRGLIDRRVTSLLIQHHKSVARYGVDTIRETEGIMSRGLVTAASPSKMVDEVQDAISGSRWRAERIVRTEMAWSANAGAADGMRAQGAAMPDLWMRWSEHCDEVTYVPLDNRVGVDSIAMTGQLARPGGLFYCPPIAPHPDAKGEVEVSRSLAGRSWSAPPNRPNDRSALVPWRPHWGDVGGWVWRGHRVPITAESEASQRAA